MDRVKIGWLILPAAVLFLLGILYSTLFMQRANVTNGLMIGEQFQKGTALTWGSATQYIFQAKPKKASPYKEYPGKKRIKLPSPQFQGIPLENAIKRRRSIRNYSTQLLTLPQLSQLLFAAQGVTGMLYGHALRTTPSAGALYPCEIYLVVNRVQGLPQGLYHYVVGKHALEFIRKGDLSKKITNVGLKQEMLGDANVTFVITAIFNRVRRKYGERGYRYAYLEAGHIGQNIALQAVSLGLGSVNIGAFFDDAVNRLIGINGHDESAIYLQAVGTL